MDALIFTSLKILLTIFLSAKFRITSSSESTNQTQFIYNGFQKSNLNLSGIAEIHPNGLLQLTNTSYQQIGRAFFPFPFNFINTTSGGSLSFSTTFVFAMVPELPTHGGHGIAFFISPSTDFVGAMATQYLGLLNLTNDGSPSNHLVAVELDSAKSPDLEDINANHVGIDLNSLKSNVSAPVTCVLDRKNETLELISGDPMQVWIEYDDINKIINVTVAPRSTKKPQVPLLSAQIDLSPIFLESMYVGFSASTGSVSSHHYILGWSFNKGAGEAPSLDIFKLPKLPKFKSKRNLITVGLLIVLISLVVSIFCAALVAAYVIRRKKYEELLEDWEEQYGPQRFRYQDLYRATKGFKDEELIGVGGFGKVYKGVLPCSNTSVAVKKFSHDSAQGMKEFVAEIASMGRLRHRNLVQLLGYCRRKGELLLVYDYMPNGSLDKVLFRSNNNQNPVLDWNQRFRILKDVASVLVYLHEEWEQVVLHRDVKASNVLLDENLNARLGDFGLSKFYDHGSNPETTCVVGTIGYLAPELIKTGKSTTRSDVFAFGSFMLEIACGKRPFDPHWLQKGMILADWVFECWKIGDIMGTCDPKLEGNYVVEEMEMVLKLGVLCTNPVPNGRPGMREVVQCLDGNGNLPDELPLDIFSDNQIGLVTTYHNSSISLDSMDSTLIYGR